MIQFKIKLCMEFLLTISLALFANYDLFARPNFSENYCGDDPYESREGPSDFQLLPSDFRLP